MDCAHLSGSGLSDETISRGLCSAIWTQSKTLDMCMRRRPVLARIPLHLTDLDHCERVAASRRSHGTISGYRNKSQMGIRKQEKTRKLACCIVDDRIWGSLGRCLAKNGWSGRISRAAGLTGSNRMGVAAGRSSGPKFFLGELPPPLERLHPLSTSRSSRFPETPDCCHGRALGLLCSSSQWQACRPAWPPSPPPSRRRSAASR